MFEKYFIRESVFLDIVLKHDFFGRVIFEIFFKTFVADYLFLELLNFLVSYSFVRKRLKNLVDSPFHFGHLMP